MRLESLREEVCIANKALVTEGLVTLTWGNVSGYDADSGLVAIKPSGVDYEKLTPGDIVIVDLEGEVVEGDLRPSSDTPTHVLLYKHFEGLGGVTHTHSRHATTFSQVRMPIPCEGTTHADHFNGPVPVTRVLNEQEVEEAYEANTGHVIIELFNSSDDLDPQSMPGVLVAGHAPFTWGKSPMASVKNSVALEAVAAMAMGARTLTTEPTGLESWVLRKHYERKHGPKAYYGQK